MNTPAVKIGMEKIFKAKRLDNGCKYSFKHDGKLHSGKYDHLSGNFFVGGDEDYINHHYFYEVSACTEIIKKDRSI